MRHLKGLAVALALALIALGGYAVAASGHGSSGWQPTAAQTSLAQQVAIDEAISMDPNGSIAIGPPGASAGWPTYVRTAIFAATTRKVGITFTDAATTDDDRDVFVIEMTGDFKVVLPSVPRGVDPIVRTHGVTLVIDAQDGLVLDASLEVPDQALPNSADLM